MSNLERLVAKMYVVNLSMLPNSGGGMSEPLGTASAMRSRMALVRSAMSRVSALACCARCTPSKSAFLFMQSPKEMLSTDLGDIPDGKDAADGTLQRRKGVGGFSEGVQRVP